MKCEKCFTKAAEGDVFCRACGEKITWKNSSDISSDGDSEHDKLMSNLSLPGFEYGKVVVGFVLILVVAVIAIVLNASSSKEAVLPSTISTPQAPQIEVQEPTETIGQENARLKAEQYLMVGGFSKKGLINQLKFEGFTSADSKYAVENIDVDWEEQAAIKAEQYMSSQAFSANGLIAQLIYEGFTDMQAAYGAYMVGFRP